MKQSYVHCMPCFLELHCPAILSAFMHWRMVFLKCFESDFIIEAMTLMLWAQKLTWKPGFGEQDSLDCILEKQDHLESCCLCPRFQVRFLPYPSLYAIVIIRYYLSFLVSGSAATCEKVCLFYSRISYYQTASSFTKTNLHFFPAH